MFKNFLSILRSIHFTLSGIRTELYDISRTFITSCSLSGCFYVVEVVYEDCTSTSDPLFTLQAVNDFINFVALVRRPTSIRVIKKFDDGR